MGSSLFLEINQQYQDLHQMALCSNRESPYGIPGSTRDGFLKGDFSEFSALCVIWRHSTMRLDLIYVALANSIEVGPGQAYCFSWRRSVRTSSIATDMQRTYTLHPRYPDLLDTKRASEEGHYFRCAIQWAIVHRGSVCVELWWCSLWCPDTDGPTKWPAYRAYGRDDTTKLALRTNGPVINWLQPIYFLIFHVECRYPGLTGKAYGKYRQK